MLSYDESESAHAIPGIFSDNGVKTSPYVSHTLVRCDRCGQSIQAGMAYTRQELPATQSLHIICQDCQPFRLINLPHDPARAATQPLAH